MPADPVVCPPGLVSGNQWRLQHGHSGVPVLEEQVDSTTDFEGDPDPEGLSESFVYTEKRASLHSSFELSLNPSPSQSSTSRTPTLSRTTSRPGARARIKASSPASFLS